MANLQKATLAAGCFWCIESAVNMLKGVNTAVSGYTGGETLEPTYQDICTGTTGHAEAVEIEFDADVISFEQLLTVFFQLHDPTQLNRQGNDVGTQYRSAIFYHDEAQQQIAKAFIAQMTEDAIWPAPIVTELAPSQIFYPAEQYHQGYALNNPQQPYCAMVVNPKLAKFKEAFVALLK